MTDLLEHFGTGPDWNAMAAIATFAAVVVALRESQRAARAERDRRQASIVAAMIIMNSAASIIGRLIARYKGAHENTSEVFRSSVQLGGLRQVLEPAMAIDLTQLPTMEAIDWVMAGRHSIEVADLQITSLANELEPDTYLFEAQHTDLLETVAALSKEARKFKPWLERLKLEREGDRLLKRERSSTET